MSTLKLTLDTDDLLKVSSLYNTLSASYINTATVTVTLQDKNGVDVVGDSWPLSLSYVAASNGVYTATLLDTLVLTHLDTYVAKVVADDGPGLKRTWYLPIVAHKGIV